jgi:hypothetical protein
VQKRIWLASVVCLVFGVAGVARADDQAQAVIDKAIKAKGGEEALAKYKAQTTKGKGMFYGMGDGIPFTIEGAECFPDRSKQAVAADVQGNPFKMTTVLSGDKGWVNTNGDVNEMDKDRLGDKQSEVHALWVGNLVALKDKDNTCKLIGDSKVGDKDVVGIKISCKGRPDVSLYFDKTSGLLVKRETKGKDMSGQEVNEEVTYSDYKDVDGIQEPMKISIKHDGNKFIETEILELKHHEKLDDSNFAKP